MQGLAAQYSPFTEGLTNRGWAPPNLPAQNPRPQGLTYFHFLTSGWEGCIYREGMTTREVTSHTKIKQIGLQLLLGD